MKEKKLEGMPAMTMRTEPSRCELLAAFEDVGHTVRWLPGLGGRAIGEVTCQNTQGYLQVGFKKERWLLHRLLWIMRNGSIPYGYRIDHIDGNKLNNQPSNMRLATLAENARNALLRSDNTSGVKGVQWYKRYGKWMAIICVNGRNRNLGYFADKLNAENAVKAARLRLHREFSNNGVGSSHEY